MESGEWKKKDLKSMTLEELTEFVKELGEKPFRAKQLYQWMHEKLAASLDEVHKPAESV